MAGTKKNARRALLDRIIIGALVAVRLVSVLAEWLATGAINFASLALTRAYTAHAWVVCKFSRRHTGC